MTSLQSMNGGNCNNGHENSSNNNLLLLQTSPVISNNSSQSLTVNNLNHDNHQTNTITSSHITQDQQNNMSHINNGYQVNIHFICVSNQTAV